MGKRTTTCIPGRSQTVHGLLRPQGTTFDVIDTGFYDRRYQWADTALTFRDGRELDLSSGRWSNCGDTPVNAEKRGPIEIRRGLTCLGEDWCELLVNGEKVVHPAYPDHPRFGECSLSPNDEVNAVQLALFFKTQLLVFVTEDGSVLRPQAEIGRWCDGGRLQEIRHQTGHGLEVIFTNLLTGETSTHPIPRGGSRGECELPSTDEGALDAD
jgi:hypothetical protein